MNGDRMLENDRMSVTSVPSGAANTIPMFTNWFGFASVAYDLGESVFIIQRSPGDLPLMATSGASDVGVACVSSDDGRNIMPGSSIAGIGGVNKWRHGPPKRWSTHGEDFAVEFKSALCKEAEFVSGNGLTFEPDDGLGEGLGCFVREDG